ncbi:MAG: ribonuclease HII [Chitinophagales bacterium]|nr:ribonuclease HII [Chitinophagales bacterium]
MLKRYFHKTLIEAGCDEAGRGCLAGPVTAAAVVLPKNFSNRKLNDSKQLSHDDRLELREVIQQKALAYAVCFIDHTDIDRFNILQASFMAMHGALDQLAIRPELLLIDGNRFRPYRDIPHQCIIQGDGLYMSIAAASILAKTYRDEHMVQLHQQYPHYGWHTNKGYPTNCHRQGIAEHGTSPYHRLSFQLLPQPQQGLLFEAAD